MGVIKKGFISSSHTVYFSEHKMVHQNQRAYVCEVCGKGYNWRAHLRRHRKTHTGTTIFLHLQNAGFFLPRFPQIKTVYIIQF